MHSATPPPSRLGARLSRAARVEPRERRAVALAFCCYFVLYASYYILRPVRDTIATVFGADALQWLFTGTFIGSLIASPIYAAVASRIALQRLLPGVFWFWLLNVLLFDALLAAYPASRLVAGSYYVWFSVVNLFMVSVLWSLMADTFSPDQSARLFPLVAAGGELGAIAGPLVTRFAVHAIGLGGLLLVAAGGFLAVIVLVHLLMREKASLRQSGEAQRSTLDHPLPGNPFEGFGEVVKSAYSRHQAAFMFLMTWVATVAYFFQTEIIAESVSGIAGRAVVIADIALAVNILSAVILLGGLGRFIQRFGVTAGLVATPAMMIAAFVVVALSPTLFMIQAIQVVRSVTQFAVARPSREICFTVVEQSRRYKGKNVIDTVVYRFGDVTSAWFQAGLRAAGLHIPGAALVGIGASVLWGGVALGLGRRYEARREDARRALDAAAPSPPPGSWL
jgi:ATP:ADP antiporter, AAA family